MREGGGRGQGGRPAGEGGGRTECVVVGRGRLWGGQQACGATISYGIAARDRRDAPRRPAKWRSPTARSTHSAIKIPPRHLFGPPSQISKRMCHAPQLTVHCGNNMVCMGEEDHCAFSVQRGRSEPGSGAAVPPRGASRLLQPRDRRLQLCHACLQARSVLFRLQKAEGEREAEGGEM